MTFTIKHTPTPLEHQDDLADLVKVFTEAQPEQLFASLAVEYERGEEIVNTSVAQANSSYRGYNDEFILTLSVRVKQYEPEYRALIEAFVEQAVIGDAEEKAAEKAALIKAKQEQAQQLIADAARLQDEIEALNA
jgi:hypothetical protein